VTYTKSLDIRYSMLLRICGPGIKQQSRPGALSSASPDKCEDRLPYTSFPIYNCLIILPFDTFSVLAVASLKTAKLRLLNAFILRTPSKKFSRLASHHSWTHKECGTREIVSAEDDVRVLRYCYMLAHTTSYPRWRTSSSVSM
jgi:hypothetical protein